MDTRKVTLIATIAVIALLAVGIGYAYTAATDNSNNTAGGEYVILSQSGTGAYKFANGDKVFYDTVTTGTPAAGQTPAAITAVNYKLSDNKDTTTFTNQTVVKVGKAFQINAQQVGSTDHEALSLTVSASTGFAQIDSFWTFYMTIGTNKYIYVDNTWKTFDPTTPSAFTAVTMTYGTDGYNPVEVQIYYGYATNNPEGKSYTTGGAPTTVLDGASITFLATLASHENNPTS